MENKHKDVRDPIVWALHEVVNKVKIPLLITRFKSGSEKDKFKIMTFLDEVYDSRLEKFYLDVLSQDYDPILKISAISSSSAYSTDAIIEMLLELTEGFKGPLAYYCLMSLYKIDHANHQEIITNFINTAIPRESNTHQIILKMMKDKDISSINRHFLCDYLMTFFSEDSINNLYTAVEACVKTYDDNILSELLVILSYHKDKTLNVL